MAFAVTAVAVAVTGLISENSLPESDISLL